MRAGRAGDDAARAAYRQPPEVEVQEERRSVDVICPEAERFGADWVCLSSHGQGASRSLHRAVAKAVHNAIHRCGQCGASATARRLRCYAGNSGGTGVGPLESEAECLRPSFPPAPDSRTWS